MRLLHRKSRWERMVVEPISQTLDLPAAARFRLLNPPKVLKPGLATLGGLLGLTAGSAAVSAVRHRSESRDLS